MLDTLKKTLLNTPKNIAILGLSPDPTKTSHQVAQYLLQKGFNIIPIYPKGGEILGKKAYHSLQEAFSEESIQKNGEIEILNIFRKSEALKGIAEEIIELPNKPKCVWIQLGLQSQEAKNILEQNNLLYIENSCIKLEHQRLFYDCSC
ncbi:CoA-binding protein [Helicobacter mesocricetorum]|uniref:CoA-binding protein n=1 Tax=Helicobacter mesocricetorum TaxID=87012 RepID=UPI000CF14A4F|nr:CoA-binding protein [Helicobacter mesocricetorum]